MRLSSPHFLLILPPLFWSGNFVLGRAVHLDIPPIGFAFWRWTLALAIALLFCVGPLRRQWGLVKRHWGWLTVLGLLGVAGFNTFVYLGLQTTTATNGVLLQSVVPVLILVLSWLFFREPVRPVQLAGILLSLLGVVAIITRGDWTVLSELRVVRGDLWVMCAVFSWALYSVLLRKRPRDLDPLAFLGASMIVGVLALLPLYLWEYSSGAVMRLNQVTIASVAYVAVFPSVLAYIFWNRGVHEVGANRAGQFLHLMPLFGTLLSILLLGERLQFFHLVGALLILGGIWLSGLRRRSA